MATIYKVIFENEKQIEKDLRKIAHKEINKIMLAIDTKLANDPIACSKPLKGSFYGYRRLRVGDYRVVFRINQGSEQIFIATICHRKDVYEG